MGSIAKIFDKKAVTILGVIFVALFILENRYRLRKTTQKLVERIPTNTLVALPSFSLLRFLFLPAMVKLAQQNEKYSLGRVDKFPPFFRWIFTFLLLDYGNYLWHVLNHKIPVLWRFHLVHHTDLDMDTTTAFRFHFGEMIGSVFSRGLFVLLTQASVKQVLYYELLFEGATQFHHSNLKIPPQVEAKINRLLVTPRMHGIHHSVNKQETNSNYSVIFSFWDKIHATFKAKPKQSEIIIGVPDYRDAEKLTHKYLLAMPFKKQLMEKPD